jgi:hypothetical protein
LLINGGANFKMLGINVIVFVALRVSESQVTGLSYTSLHHDLGIREAFYKKLDELLVK